MFKKGLRHLVLVFLSILTSMTAEAQNFTLSNNLLYDAALTVRYWTDSLKVGHFFGANFIYSHFNAGYTNLLLYKGVKDERRQGDLIALGVFYGYSWQLGRRWTMEAQVGAAVGYAWYDRFDLDEHGDYWLSLGSGKSAFVLPQLGLNFVYHFTAFSKKPDNSKSYGILKSSDIERKY